MEKASNEQFEAFLLTAEKYNLNPIMKQMWAYPDRSGGIQTMVSIDGWIQIVNSQESFDGFETNTNFGDDGKPLSSTCIIYRKDRNRPTTKTVHYSEWVNNSSPVWKNMPVNMLEHRAFIQCARFCFNITGIQDEQAVFHTEKEKSTPIVSDSQKAYEVESEAGYTVQDLLKKYQEYDLSVDMMKKFNNLFGVIKTDPKTFADIIDSFDDYFDKFQAEIMNSEEIEVKDE